MYTLEVLHAGEKTPVKTLSALHAQAAMDAIPRLLEEHAGCDKVVVKLGYNVLFVVDCQGSVTPGTDAR